MAIFSAGDRTVEQDNEGSGVTVGGASNNEITIELYTASFAPGMVECELQVYSGAQKDVLVTSAKFNFTCRRGLVNEATLSSTNEWPLLADALRRTETLEDGFEAMSASASAAESERNTAEIERIAKENMRTLAEADRQVQEEKRETAWMAVVEATDAANVAADNFEELILRGMEPHSQRHSSGGEDAITPTSIGAMPPPRIFETTLLASSWVDKKQNIRFADAVVGDTSVPMLIFLALSESVSEQTREKALETGLYCERVELIDNGYYAAISMFEDPPDVDIPVAIASFWY